MITVANPVYDSVFKYLIDDERIARTILSALLKEEVIEVNTKRNEYPNIGRDNLSIFRVDFIAKVKKRDGDVQLILIELQKTWLETETLRFRQYLGAQYANKENMKPADGGAYAIPMVTVYLLGHKVGNIEEPVLYVKRQSFDYNNMLVTKGLPDPFVDSLTHDSIIVQIPRLQGQVNTKLDKVLSFFNQSTINRHNQQMLDIDETLYGEDAEIQLIMKRLLSAASDAKIRHEMNVEDEFFSVIEKRDTEILMRDKALAEKEVLLNEKEVLLNEKNVKLEEQNVKLEEQTVKLEEQNVKLEEQNVKLEEQSVKLEEQSVKLEEQNVKLEEQSVKLEEQQSTIRSSVRLFHKSGMKAEDIAANLNLDLQLVNSYINEAQEHLTMRGTSTT